MHQTTKTVYTENHEDYQTGEVISRSWVTKKVQNTEAFLRTYLEDIGKLARCSGAEMAVVLASLQFVDYDTNELIINPRRREDICTTANLKMNTVNTAIARLQKKNIFVKVEGRLYLNPKLFFFGSDISRTRFFELKIQYQILEDAELNKAPKKYLFNFSKIESAKDSDLKNHQEN